MQPWLTTHCGAWRRTLALFVVAFSLAGALSSGATQKFYDDDPITQEPDTQDASGVQATSIHLAWDEALNLFGHPGERGRRRALNVNTIDEVPDSSWFTNRVGSRLMVPADIVAGPANTEGPAPGKWTVLSGKIDGVSPGLTIRDSLGVRWFIKFDPPDYPELATGAEVVSTKLFWALGYNVPENHIATLQPGMLELAGEAKIESGASGLRRMTAGDVGRVLWQAARQKDGSYRVVASRALEGHPLGGFRYYGTRPDDPNDIVPHEHRRELRALHVFGAWLNHVDSKAINSLDTLVQDDGRATVRHHLIDFGSTLGSAAIKLREYDEGHEYIFEGRTFVRGLTPFGLYIRPWRTISYPAFRSIGNIEADHFDPVRWRARVPNAAHRLARPDDTFWAARKVSAITDQMIAAAIGSAKYSDLEAAAYLTQTLIKRRDRISEIYLTAVNPVVRPTFDGTTLTFENAAVAAGVASAPAAYQAAWYTFDNASRISEAIGTPLIGSASGMSAPPGLPTAIGSFVRIAIAATGSSIPSWSVPVQAYFRLTGRGWTLVGLDRESSDELR